MNIKKKTIYKYGSVRLPLETGRTAWYNQKGSWRNTDIVERILVIDGNHVVFETAKYRYCIEFQEKERMAMGLAA
ncbi:MAG: hypothetical protein LIP10_03975 [Clostridiales bacterium]|nr:hypothetical protein [Clostridiales bacterium]